MSARSTLAAGITAADRELFLSTCTVTRSGARTGQIDETTGRRTGGAPVDVHQGPCWVKLQQTGAARSTSSGGDLVLVQAPFVALPMSAPTLRIGDLIRVTASPNPANVGRTFKVTSLPLGDFVVAARYGVEVQTG